jgi:hypothetical protein
VRVGGLLFTLCWFMHEGYAKTQSENPPTALPYVKECLKCDMKHKYSNDCSEVCMYE